MKLQLEEFMKGINDGSILPSYYDESTKQIGNIFFGDYIPTLKYRPTYYTMTGIRKDRDGVWVDVYTVAVHRSSHANEYREAAREILAEEGVRQ